ECLLWVISGHSRRFERCPLYLRKRTSFSRLGSFCNTYVAVVYFSPRLLRRFVLALKAFSIRRRIASGRECQPSFAAAKNSSRRTRASANAVLYLFDFPAETRFILHIIQPLHVIQIFCNCTQLPITSCKAPDHQLQNELCLGRGVPGHSHHLL